LEDTHLQELDERVIRVGKRFELGSQLLEQKVRLQSHVAQNDVVSATHVQFHRVSTRLRAEEEEESEEV